MQCQRIGVELQIRIFHLAGGFPKKLQPPLKQFGSEAGQGHMLGHGGAPKMARSAQLHRPEIDHLHKMCVPIGNMRFKNRAQQRIFSGSCIKSMNQPRNFLFSTQVRIGCYKLWLWRSA